MKKILDEITNDVKDIKAKKFEYTTTKVVPSRHDTSLSFESGSDKLGKIINTCVLYVDIRKSVELNRIHHTQTMGRIYSVFSKSMLKLAKYHSGAVRNIIGDRVMIVFPSDKCFTNAVNCAISINHVSSIINNTFTDVEFSCGIGIDYGELKVIKVGLKRIGTENFDNKNLVWVGYPANIASRLTDVANKSVDLSEVIVTYLPYNYGGIYGLGLIGNLGGFPGHKIQTPSKLYQDSPIDKVHSLEDFAKAISFDTKFGLSYSGGKFIKFEKKERKIKFQPILMTKTVYVGFKSENPTSELIKSNYLVEISNHNIKNITQSIYGGDTIWKL